jgi:hypothetical protein
VKRDVNEPYGFKYKKADRMRNLLSLLLLVLLVGCTADIAPETAEPTPGPTPTDTPTVRLATINRDWVGPLGSMLELNEPDTFAGIWLDNEAQRVAVAFTEGAKRSSSGICRRSPTTRWPSTSLSCGRPNTACASYSPTSKRPTRCCKRWGILRLRP